MMHSHSKVWANIFLKEKINEYIYLVKVHWIDQKRQYEIIKYYQKKNHIYNKCCSFF